MTSIRLMIAILLVGTVSSAHADPIPTYQVTLATMHMVPNTVGDNIRFAFTGPGVEITGIAGMGCFDWCTGQPIPLDTPTATSEIFLSTLETLTLGGTSFFPTAAFVGRSFFDTAGGLVPSTTFFPADATTLVKVTLPTNGGWSFNFASTTDQSGNPAMSFVDGTFSAEAPVVTPEPATLGLMLVGSAGLGWWRRRQQPTSDLRSPTSDLRPPASDLRVCDE